MCELYLSKTEDESKIQKLKNHIDDIGEKISYCHYSSENPIGDQNEILEEYKLGPGSIIFEAIENQPDLTISTTPSDANKQLNNMLKKIDSMKRSGKIDDQKILRRFDLVCFVIFKSIFNQKNQIIAYTKLANNLKKLSHSSIIAVGNWNTHAKLARHNRLKSSTKIKKSPKIKGVAIQLFFTPILRECY